ncbi:hypothetical protein D9M69_368480 [compost metagenome]
MADRLVAAVGDAPAARRRQAGDGRVVGRDAGIGGGPDAVRRVVQFVVDAQDQHAPDQVGEALVDLAGRGDELVQRLVARRRRPDHQRGEPAHHVGTGARVAFRGEVEGLGIFPLDQREEGDGLFDHRGVGIQLQQWLDVGRHVRQGRAERPRNLPEHLCDFFHRGLFHQLVDVAAAVVEAVLGEQGQRAVRIPAALARRAVAVLRALDQAVDVRRPVAPLARALDLQRADVLAPDIGVEGWQVDAEQAGSLLGGEVQLILVGHGALM